MSFPALEALPCVRHAFTLRLPGVNGSVPLDHGKLVIYHEAVLNTLETTRTSLVTANQVHGSQICVVRTRPRLPIPDTDGLLTKTAGLPIGVYVADCCAVYLVDRRTPAIGLLHSGRKGTLAGIAGEAIDSMRRAFDTRPSDVLAVLGPCVGPCHYEMDIPSAIGKQLRDAGVGEIVNSGICTACDLDRFYSYRAEQGQTGRMLAVMMLR